MRKAAFTGIAIVATFAAIIALPARAQSSMGYGQGRGMQAGQGGMGQNMTARGTGPRGAGLMTTAERTAFQQKMRQVKTVDECLKVQGEQRAAMAVRATERGVTLPEPRQNACENMKARGWIK